MSSHVLKWKEAVVQRREGSEARRCRDWQREGGRAVLQVRSLRQVAAMPIFLSA